jgi:hypothetical protein
VYGSGMVAEFSDDQYFGTSLQGVSMHGVELAAVDTTLTFASIEQGNDAWFEHGV